MRDPGNAVGQLRFVHFYLWTVTVISVKLGFSSNISISRNGSIKAQCFFHLTQIRMLPLMFMLRLMLTSLVKTKIYKIIES